MESCFLWGQRFSSSGFCSPGDESHSSVNGLGLLDPQQEGDFVWRTLYHNEQLQVLASFSAKWVIMLAGVRQKLSGICWFPAPTLDMGWALGRLPPLGTSMCKMERMPSQT